MEDAAFSSMRLFNMRYLIAFLLLSIATPVSAQTMNDRFTVAETFEAPALVQTDSSSAITTRKIIGSVGGTLVGSVAGAAAGFLLAGSGEDILAGLIGMVVGSTAGATAGAYIPGESPPSTLLPTLGMAALGTVVGTGLGLAVPPLALAGPPAGALLGFALAYQPADVSAQSTSAQSTAPVEVGERVRIDNVQAGTLVERNGRLVIEFAEREEVALAEVSRLDAWRCCARGKGSAMGAMAGVGTALVGGIVLQGVGGGEGANMAMAGAAILAVPIGLAGGLLGSTVLAPGEWVEVDVSRLTAAEPGVDDHDLEN